MRAKCVASSSKRRRRRSRSDSTNAQWEGGEGQIGLLNSMYDSEGWPVPGSTAVIEPQSLWRMRILETRYVDMRKLRYCPVPSGRSAGKIKADSCSDGWVTHPWLIDTRSNYQGSYAINSYLNLDGPNSDPKNTFRSEIASHTPITTPVLRMPGPSRRICRPRICSTATNTSCRACPALRYRATTRRCPPHRRISTQRTLFQAP